MSNHAARMVNHDEPLVARILLALKGHLNPLVEHLRVHSIGGELVLGGQVRSHYAKQMIQHTVMKLTHGTIVANEIEVVGESHQQRYRHVNDRPDGQSG